MPDLQPFFVRWSPRLLSVLRIAAAALFMAHGSQKLFGVPSAEPRDPVALVSQMGLAGVLEFFGGLLILLGLFTRPVALVLAALMVAAYLIAHAPKSPWPILNGGELALLYLSVFLYLSVAGGGAWSVDDCCRGKTSPPAEKP
jgi:putative oxidoreductase